MAAETDDVLGAMFAEVEGLRAAHGIPQRGEPVDPDSGPSSEELWAYVEDLENMLAAQRVAKRLVRGR